MKMYLDNFKAFLVSLSLIYYFSPIAFIGVNEIYPWYILMPLLIWTSYKHYILVIFGFIGVVLIAFLNLKIALDFAQIVAIFVFLFWYNKISERRVKLIVFWVKRFLIFLTLFLILQKLIPDLFGPMTKLFAFREGLDIDHRTGGVRGIAPEPSYMAMTLLGIGVILWLENGQLSLIEQLLVALSVLLCGSIVGYGGLLLFLLLHNQKILIRAVVNLCTSAKIYKYLPYILIFSVIIIYVFWSSFAIPIARFLDLFYAIASNWDGSLNSILMAERQFKSQRLQELLTPFTQICCGYFFTGEFDKNYSFYGLLWAFFAPLHLILFYPLIMHPLLKGRFTAVRLFSIIMAAAFGPVLIVSLYIGFFRKK